MNIEAELARHTVKITEDGLADAEPIVFRWHFQRSIGLSSRMSALELSRFLIDFMPHVIPLLSDHPRVQDEFRQLYIRFASWPSHCLDEVWNWVRCIPKGEEDTIIELSLRGRLKQPPATFTCDVGKNTVTAYV